MRRQGGDDQLLDSASFRSAIEFMAAAGVLNKNEPLSRSRQRAKLMCATLQEWPVFSNRLSRPVVQHWMSHTLRHDDCVMCLRLPAGRLQVGDFDEQRVPAH
jgi:hypothetical protein